MAYTYLKKTYITLALNAGVYTAALSKVKTPLAIWLIRRTGIKFRDINSMDTIQIHPLAIKEIKTLFRTISDATNTTDPSALFLIENTSLFLVNSTGYKIYNGTALVPDATTPYRGGKGLLFFRVCQAVPSITPTSNVNGRFKYNNSDIYLILSPQKRTNINITENMLYGLLQSGGNDTYTEWSLADILTFDLNSDAYATLPIVTMSGKYSLWCNVSNNGFLKTLEHRGRSCVNSLDYSESGSKSQTMRLPATSAALAHSQSGYPISLRDGCQLYKTQMLIPNYTPFTTSPYDTVPVVLYDNTITTPRLFYTQSMWSLHNQEDNALYLNGIPDGTFYMLHQAFIQKAYGLLTLMEFAAWNAPITYELLATNFTFTKIPGLYSGGKLTAATHPAYKIKMRSGMLFHVGDANVRYYFSSLLKNGDATLDLTITSKRNGAVGRILDLMVPDTTSYFYDLYNVRLCMGIVGMKLNMIYSARYEDGTLEEYKVSAAQQVGCDYGYFSVNAAGTTVTAIANPGILETDNTGIPNHPTPNDTIYGMPVGSKLFQNVGNKKIRYIMLSTSGEPGTNIVTAGSDLRDCYLGIILSPKTP